MSEPKAACLTIPARRVRIVLGELQGFKGLPTINPYEFLRDLTAGNACQFRPRTDDDTEHPNCETDERFKQLVPYLLLIQYGRILTYHRDKSGGEGRLHAMRSCGSGGHVEECDALVEGLWIRTIDEAMHRELYEETRGSIIPGDSNSSLVGFINDDSNAVGRVHLGLLYLVTLSPTAAPKFAPEIADPRWERPEEIDPAGYEGWSRIAIGAMKDGRIGDVSDPIVFLDIDGVLNTHDMLEESMCGQIHRDKVLRLNRILKVTGAKVVLSSAWRYIIHRGEATLAGMDWLLRSHGMMANRLIGITPEDTMARGVYDGIPDNWPLENERGDQIARWIVGEGWKHYSETGRHVVIDDLDLGISSAGHPLVLTDGSVGLTDHDASRAIEILWKGVAIGAMRDGRIGNASD